MNYQQAIADATKQIRCRSAAAGAAATTGAAAGSGSFSCSAAAETAITAADAANVLIPEGSSTRTLSHCNNEH